MTRAVLGAACLAALAAAPVAAQTIDYTPVRDCNLARKAWENPFSDTKHYLLRRYQWHGLRVTAHSLAGEGLHRITRKKLPRWASYTITGVAIGVLPHVRGVSLGHYPFNGMDWAFDAYLGAMPLVVMTGMSGGNWQSRTLAGTTLVAGYFSLACFASP